MRDVTTTNAAVQDGVWSRVGRAVRGRTVGPCLLLAWLALAGGPAAALAQTTEVVVYLHTDHLGSVRMITDAQGGVVERRDFLPFGGEVGTPATGTGVGFAGTEFDPETGNSSWQGLNYLGARHLHSGSGRFTTVDPCHVGGHIGAPQSWNGYSYAGNNPLRYIDRHT